MSNFISIDIGRRNFAIRCEDLYGKTLLFGLYDLGKGDINKQVSVLTEWLKEWDEFFVTSHVVLIEKQYQVGRQINNCILNNRVLQHVFTYCQLFYPHLELIEFDPKMKTSDIMGAPKRMNREKRKEWAVQKAYEILNKRKDTKGLAVLESYRKKDDLADCLVQLVAYRKLQFSN